MANIDRLQTLEHVLSKTIRTKDQLRQFHHELKLDPFEVPDGLLSLGIRDLVAGAGSLDRLDLLQKLAMASRIKRTVDENHPRIPDRVISEKTLWVAVPDLSGLITEESARNTWERNYQAMKKRVCRISVKGVPGTGFLVAPNVVLTCYHVVDTFIENKRPGTDINVWFDYQPGKAAPSGELHALHDDWLIDHSTPSSLDELAFDAAARPDPNELDYALLRLRDDPGKTRGFIKVPTGEPLLAKESPLTILQYAAFQPFEIAMSPEGMQGLNGNKTRMWHKVNTLDGSSGAPIFDLNWNLVAMHRDYVTSPPGMGLKLNVAVPIARIRERFRGNMGISQRVRAEVGW